MRRTACSALVMGLSVGGFFAAGCGGDDATPGSASAGAIGGSSTGGSNTGGSNAGGSNAGGANAGGANAGGANAGGANAGGANAGGTNAGGTNAGGTNAGGANAGGAGLTGAEAALAACDHTKASEQELWALAKATLATIATRRALVQTSIFGLASDGTVGPSTVTGIDWDPSHDSVLFSVNDPERTVPLLVPNDVAKGTKVPSSPLAVAGEIGAAKHVVFGANPLHDLARTNEPGGKGNAALGNLVERSIRWLTGNQDAAGAGLNVVVAHLPDSYWFKHDATTRSWLTSRFPSATISASDACESAKLGGCLATANLLVIGQDDGAEDDHGIPYDADAILAAVTAAQAKGVPVLYVHFDGTRTRLGDRLLSYFRLGTTDNYWDQAQDVAFSPAALAQKDASLAALTNLVGTLSQGSLSYADYASCVGDASTLPSCEAAPFRAALGDGLDVVRAAVASLDGEIDPLCAKEGLRLLKLLVLLGDKYRAGDASRPALAYPVDWKNDAPALGRAAFADASVCYVRPASPAQTNLGTFVCPRANVLAGTCKTYDIAAVPRVSGTITEPFRAGDEWTSTGFYALPGVPFTVKRTDTSAGRVAVRLNPQREGSTRSLEADKDISNYDRPQYLASTWLYVDPGEQAVITTPYGGAIYLRLEGSSATVGQTASLDVTGAAKHPAVLDIGNAPQVAAFLAEVKTSPLPFVDIRGEGFEAHLRKDKFLNGAAAAPYDGDLAKLFTDYRDNFVGAVYALAGFRIPGKTLEQTLSADVRAICTQNGWDCLDGALHARKSIQHANYDQYASCGYGCSGNPFDAGWDLSPIGWGDSHELGHNLQMGALDIGWVAEADRNRWSAYEKRAGENSNNMFPYHTLWRYERTVKANDGPVLDDHMSHRDFFAVAQSDQAGLTGTVNGTTRKTVYDASCTLQGDFDPASTGNRASAIWSDGGYAADNGLRMSFYLALPLMLHGKKLAVGPALTNGFDGLTLLYLQARLFQKAADDDATWLAAREGLGFGTFPRQGDATYDGKSVGDIPGNDFLLVAASYLTGLDFRPYFDSRGVRYSALAAAQVQAHRTSGRITADAPTGVPVLDTDLPGKDLAAVPWTPIDGKTPWPRDGFSPTTCSP